MKYYISSIIYHGIFKIYGVYFYEMTFQLSADTLVKKLIVGMMFSVTVKTVALRQQGMSLIPSLILYRG